MVIWKENTKLTNFCMGTYCSSDKRRGNSSAVKKLRVGLTFTIYKNKMSMNCKVSLKACILGFKFV